MLISTLELSDGHPLSLGWPVGCEHTPKESELRFVTLPYGVEAQ